MVLNEIEVLHKAIPTTIEQNKIEVMVEEENGAIETSTKQHTSDRKKQEPNCNKFGENITNV